MTRPSIMFLRGCRRMCVLPSAHQFRLNQIFHSDTSVFSFGFLINHLLERCWLCTQRIPWQNNLAILRKIVSCEFSFSEYISRNSYSHIFVLKYANVSTNFFFISNMKPYYFIDCLKKKMFQGATNNEKNTEYLYYISLCYKITVVHCLTNRYDIRCSCYSKNPNQWNH